MRNSTLVLLLLLVACGQPPSTPAPKELETGGPLPPLTAPIAMTSIVRATPLSIRPGDGYSGVPVSDEPKTLRFGGSVLASECVRGKLYGDVSPSATSFGSNSWGISPQDITGWSQTDLEEWLGHNTCQNCAETRPWLANIVNDERRTTTVSGFTVEANKFALSDLERGPQTDACGNGFLYTVHVRQFALAALVVDFPTTEAKQRWSASLDESNIFEWLPRLDETELRALIEDGATLRLTVYIGGLVPHQIEQALKDTRCSILDLKACNETIAVLRPVGTDATSVRDIDALGAEWGLFSFDARTYDWLF